MVAVSSLCVFCGSLNGSNQNYHKLTQKVGKMAAHNDMRIIYGGANIGLMKILADSCLKNGGNVMGIIPKALYEKELAHKQLHTLKVTESMQQRKALMFKEAEAFLILPGGFGTLDELFEIATYRHIGLHNKPIYLLNCENYWKPLILLLNHVKLSGFFDNDIADLITVVDGVDELFSLLKH
tara:strand:- start:8388 stop:8933 length:546 start_codon:yes stop_codon:yes gene_type:complete